MKESRITVRLPIELRRRVKAAARTEGKRESDVTREAVEQHVPNVSNGPTALERLRRAGFIGCIHDTPADLSTNRKYFNGFGDD